MAQSRRSFLQTIGLGGAGVVALGRSDLFAARGREALAGLPPWERDAAHEAFAPAAAIRLSSNENPLGPGEKALAAIREAFETANRYPVAPETAARAAIAKSHGIPEDRVLVGCGSGEILRMAVFACVTPERPLVGGAPTFEDPSHYARSLKSEPIDVPVDGDLKLDLEQMAARAKGAGLVFLCNPNNPTGTVHGAAAVSAFVERVLAASPNTTILIDEAYHEYVEDPSYRTSIPMALDNPRVIVARTFSKVFGMAGLRIGYAIGRPEALEPLAKFKLGNAVNALAAAGAITTIADTDRIAIERARNRAVRQLTRETLTKAGYVVAASDTNFVMVNVRRDVKTVIDACKKDGVLIGRPFPPLTTWARISIGTMEEMERALGVLRGVLGTATAQG